MPTTMLNGSFKIGRVAGIAVNVHWSVLLIAALLGAGLAPALGWPAAVVAVVAFLGSILAHELSHALVARRFGVGTLSIELWVLGGVARLDRQADSPRAEGWIAAAGPLASFAVGAGSLAAWLGLGATATDAPLVRVLFWLGFVNLVLGLFNLLPGAPLDGGRILKAIRWRVHGDRYRAIRDAGTTGRYLGWALAGIGLWLTIDGRPGIWLIVVGIFIVFNARAEITASYAAERLDGIKVRDLAWWGLAEAGDDMDADSMLWERQRIGAAGVVVVNDQDGRPEGLVTVERLWNVPAEERPWVMLTDLMIPLDRVARAEPDDDLTSVIGRVDPSSPVLTVWSGDRLLGVVPPQRLLEQLRSVQTA